MKKINWREFVSKAAVITKRTLAVAAVLCLMGWSSYLGTKMVGTKIVYATVETQTMPPVLQRIEQCESAGKQYTNGQILLNPNKDGSIDIGRFMINNKSWGAKATELGLDLTKDADNEKMAYWIYQNVGTGPWYSSERCWNR